jgi:hypothetical protein
MVMATAKATPNVMPSVSSGFSASLDADSAIARMLTVTLVAAKPNHAISAASQGRCALAMMVAPISALSGTVPIRVLIQIASMIICI